MRKHAPLLIALTPAVALVVLTAGMWIADHYLPWVDWLWDAAPLWPGLLAMLLAFRASTTSTALESRPIPTTNPETADPPQPPVGPTYPARLRRLTDRQAVTVLFMGLGLACWGIGNFLDDSDGVDPDGIQAFVGWEDLAYFPSIVCFIVAVWVFYQGLVRDFLQEFSTNQFQLFSVLLILNLLVLSIYNDGKFADIITTDENRFWYAAAMLYVILYLFVFWSVFRLVTSWTRQRIAYGYWSLWSLAVGFFLLYLGEMVVFVNEQVSVRGKRTVVIYEDYRWLTDVFFSVSIVTIAFGTLRLPLNRLIFRPPGTVE